MKIKLTIEVELEESVCQPDDEENRLWLENEILVGDGSLTLHSNDIGDTLGTVKKVTGLQFK